MRIDGLLTLAIGSALLSGCAGSRYAREVARLKSDVGLLDQRVNQLEQAGLRTPQSWSGESWRQPSDPTGRTPARASTGLAQPSTRHVQRALKNAGFDPGPVDGKLGPRTRRSIRDFQSANGLQADGIVGKRTWAKLAPYLPGE
ncbi:MAG: peptidoglycan-binding protein [Candidatus Omnitrophica bacterium]|nr:peptidoglycan-binding protein [Candidatus Omnitrophota bacterium]